MVLWMLLESQIAGVTVDARRAQVLSVSLSGDNLEVFASFRKTLPGRREAVTQLFHLPVQLPLFLQDQRHNTLAAQAAAFGEVVVLAFPFTALDDAMKSAGTLSGKLVFSCVNALKGDNSGLAVGTTTSAAEVIARVVEGLPAFAELLHSDSRLVSGTKPSVFVCGDDAEGKRIVTKLLEIRVRGHRCQSPLGRAVY
jgi:hypothetical protein